MGSVLFDHIGYFRLFSFGKVAVKVFGAVVLLTGGSVSKSSARVVQDSPPSAFECECNPANVSLSRGRVRQRGCVQRPVWLSPRCRGVLPAVAHSPSAPPAPAAPWGLVRARPGSADLLLHLGVLSPPWLEPASPEGAGD